MTFMVILGWALAVTFPLIYGFRFPWRQSPVGWSILNLSVVIAVALSLSLWRYVFGSVPTPVRYAIYAWIDVALAGQLAILLFAPRWNRRRLARKG